jgi:hypothetical protein
MTDIGERADYEWHFKLSEEADESKDPDALTAMVSEQVKALLRCVVLTNRGEAVRVTGFRFLDEAEGEHLVHLGPTESEQRPVGSP